MASEWYYIIDEMQYGPVSSGELRDLAVRGQLLPSSLVWREGLEGWVRAKNIKGLIVTLCQKTNKQVYEESNTLNPETEMTNVKLHTDPSINIIPEKISGQNLIPVTSENDYQGLDESSDSEERNRENKSKKLIKVVCQVASDVGSYLKAQGLLVIITLIEMPNAYYGYGKSIYQNDRFHSVFSDTFNNISNLESAISEYSTRTSIEKSNNKSGYILKKLIRIVILRGKIESLKMKKRDLFRLLGKQVYESELNCSELEKSAERISALIAKSSSLRIQREEFADSMNNSKGFIRLRRHPWLACVFVLLLLSAINSMINSGKGKYSDTVQETAVQANNVNELDSSEKPDLSTTPYEQGFDEGYWEGNSIIGNYQELKTTRTKEQFAAHNEVILESYSFNLINLKDFKRALGENDAMTRRFEGRAAGWRKALAEKKVFLNIRNPL